MTAFILLVVVTSRATQNVKADTLRALPEAQLPEDIRLQPLKDLNGYFPFTPAKSQDEWSVRAERLKRRLLVSQGLWPKPTKTDLKAVIHSKTSHGNYTIEKVYFESMPGFFVTGNLYRPSQPQGPGQPKGNVPAVLCPHGHWANGRFYDVGLSGVHNQIIQGAERFEDGGRSPLQSRCVQLARMGCVVFHYDMIGYADSVQLSYELAHRFAEQRPDMNTTERWGMFSTQAEANLQSIMGLQTWNSIRAVDFVESLPDVDPSRIAVTGASGGGTQSFILCSIEPRIAAGFSAVMVSTAMQGGCTCESSSLLRVETGNVELAALFAPKPLGLTSADDWTKELSTKGFPDLKAHYKLMGAENNVKLADLTHFKHNYNYVSRANMYPWFNKHLKLGHKEPIVEEAYKRQESDSLTVWNDEHPKPKSTPKFERDLLRWWKQDSEKRLNELVPADAESLSRYKEIVGGGIDTLIGRGLPDGSQMQYEALRKTDQGEYLRIFGTITNPAAQEQLPVLYFYPKQWNGHVVIWLHEQGKSGLMTAEGQPTEAIQKLVDEGFVVTGVDLLSQGEFLKDGEQIKETRKVGNKRQFAGYTFAYNHSLFARRVHDVLTVTAFSHSHEYQPEEVHLVGLGKDIGPIAAAARAQARDALTSAAIALGGFRFSKMTNYRSPNFLPGGAKYHDVEGMLAVAAPEKTLILTTEPTKTAITNATYAASDAANALEVKSHPHSEHAKAVSDWLIQQAR